MKYMLLTANPFLQSQEHYFIIIIIILLTDKEKVTQRLNISNAEQQKSCNKIRETSLLSFLVLLLAMVPYSTLPFNVLSHTQLYHSIFCLILNFTIQYTFWLRWKFLHDHFSATF